MLNWDKYRRILCNIDKAVANDTVTALMNIYYSLLHTELVHNKEAEGVFTDTYLKLTYNYNPAESFLELFRYYFSLLKGAYQRDSKANYFQLLKEERTSE